MFWLDLRQDIPIRHDMRYSQRRNERNLACAANHCGSTHERPILPGKLKITPHPRSTVVFAISLPSTDGLPFALKKRDQRCFYK